MPPDPAPIRGRWRIYVCPECGAVQDFGGRCRNAGHLAYDRPRLKAVEVVPVPDEAAIERGWTALIDFLGVGTDEHDFRGAAEAVLRAALEPPEAG